jgi:hypothetical protein
MELDADKRGVRAWATAKTSAPSVVQPEHPSGERGGWAAREGQQDMIVSHSHLRLGVAAGRNMTCALDALLTA